MLLSCADAAAQQLHYIQDTTDQRYGAIRISGFGENQATLRVYPQTAYLQYGDSLPPMLGRTARSGSDLFFYPRFPLRQGRVYRVFLDTLDFILEVPHAEVNRPFACIDAVFPSGDTLPANLLKWYIKFSVPMGLADPYPNIQLLDSAGQALAAPFLPLQPPLWDASRQRLTLWFDPGRIKQYLHPNQTQGPPMHAGRRYTMVISSALKDAYGRPLKADFRKTFYTQEADNSQPDPLNWQIAEPPPDTREALGLIFPESLDYGTLENRIVVVDQEGVVDGAFQIGPLERSWHFIPDHPWKAGQYRVLLHRRLEDLAGNNLERPFDRDVSAGAPTIEAPVLELSFSVGNK